MNKNIRILLGFLGIVLLIYVLWNVREIIYYFFSATILAFIARPLMRLLSKLKFRGIELPSWAKAFIVLICFVLLIFGVFQLVIPTVVKQANIISQIDAEEIVDKLDPQITSATSWLEKFGTDTEEIKVLLEDEVSKMFEIGEISQHLKGFINGLTGSIIAVFSIFFITFFLLKDGTIVDNVVASITPDKYLDSIHTILTKTKNLLSRYFIGVVLQISIIMAVISVGLTFLDVQSAIIIGLLAGIFNIIPYLGPILGILIGISLAVTTQIEVDPNLLIMPFIFKTLMVFVVAQLIDNFVLQPVIFSKSVKAHPLEIFLVILSAGTLGGILGMILAIPLYSFLRIVAQEFFNGYKVVQGLTKNL